MGSIHVRHYWGQIQVITLQVRCIINKDWFSSGRIWRQVIILHCDDIYRLEGFLGKQYNEKTDNYCSAVFDFANWVC